MVSIEGALFDFKRLDILAADSTPIHLLDARAKVLVTLLFILTVVSFGKYELTALFPFFLFPVMMIALGNLPLRYLIGKVALVLPFAFLVGMLNPLFDREVLIRFGPVGVSGGWISCASILVRAMLTVGAAFILVGVTGFTGVCRALEQLGAPKAFVTQLLFLYRYIFLLTEEGGQMARARQLRSFGTRGMEMKTYGHLIGQLLLRTWERAERVYRAMLARGFDGAFHTRRDSRFGSRELLFLLAWSLFFISFRLENVPQLVGSLVTGWFR
jgi:cobalt/nickel transport system permease protein